MKGLFTVFAVGSAFLASFAQATVCEGPDLHHLRLVGRDTLEVQGGHGRVAFTSDGGRTWQMLDRPQDSGRVFEGRIFYGSEGEQLQNLRVGDNDMVVIERTADRQDWQVRNSGLLLGVRGNSAFVYRGSLKSLSAMDRGWVLDGGTVSEEPINRDLGLAQGWHPEFKVELGHDSVCIWTENSWRGEARCEPARPLVEPFRLTGFAVQEAQFPRAGDARESTPARDVYLTDSAVIWRWEGATGTWSEVPYPPEWRWCNGPVPRGPVRAPKKAPSK